MSHLVVIIGLMTAAFLVPPIFGFTPGAMIASHLLIAATSVAMLVSVLRIKRE